MTDGQAEIIFVTGTDTDVGKTVVSVVLLKSLSANGYTTAALKPIAAGAELTDQGYVNSDALSLQRSATLEYPYAAVNPFVFSRAIAPHLAAKSESIQIDVEGCLQQSQTLLQSRADVIVVEGAGGWMVPLNDEQTMADLAVAMGAGVIVVVAVRLGCLSHALLTISAIQKSGLVIRGWIANHPHPKRAECADENISTLISMINAPFLGELPYVADVESPDLLECLDIAKLMASK